MKDEVSIFDYYKMTQKINEDIRLRNQMVDPSSLYWEADLFQVFKAQGLIKEYTPEYYINFWQYYEAGEGWSFDKVPHVINLL